MEELSHMNGVDFFLLLLLLSEQPHSPCACNQTEPSPKQKI